MENAHIGGNVGILCEAVLCFESSVRGISVMSWGNGVVACPKTKENAAYGVP